MRPTRRAIRPRGAVPRAAAAAVAAVVAAVPMVLATPAGMNGGGAAAAEPVLVHGRAQSPAGEPLAGALVELVPFLDRYSAGLLEFHGRPSPEPIARTVTGEDGSFLLLGPEMGLWRVVVSAPGRLAVSQPLLTLSSETALPPAALAPSQPRAVRVVGPDGAPVAGARVVVTTAGDASAYAEFSAQWAPLPRVATTGEDGTVRLPVAAGEEVLAQAVAAGAVTAATGPLAGPRPLEIRLVPSPCLPLVVRDADGRPAAGVVVAAGFPPRPLGTTGADGRLAGGLAAPAADAGLTLRTPDGQLQEVRPGPPAGEPPTFTVRLDETTWTSGRVVEADGGDPIAGALVFLLSDPTAFARSEGDGHFRLPRRPPELSTPMGTVDLPLMAFAPGHLPGFLASGAGHALPPGTEPSIPLERAAVIAGTVVDADGRPVEEFRLRIEPLSMAAARSAAIRGEPPSPLPGGRFQAGPLVPGESYALTALVDGFPPARVEVQAPRRGEEEAPVRLVVARGGRASGRVIDAGGGPLAGAVAELWPTPAARTVWPPDGRTAVSGADGRFTLEGVSAGRFDLVVRATGFAPARVRGVEIEDGRGETDLGRVALSPGAAVAGRVVEEDGTPIAGAMVSTSDGDPTAAAGATTDQTGHFQLDGLAPDTVVRITVFDTSGRHRSLDRVPVPPAEPLRIVMPAVVRVRGRVVDEAGTGIPGARLVDNSIMVGPEGLEEALTPGWRTDDEGRFAIDSGPDRLALSVTVSAAGRESRTIADLAALAAEGGGEAVVVLGPAVILTGRVVEGNGRPISGVALTAVTASLAEATAGHQLGFVPGFPHARTDGDGRYAFADLARGEHVLTADHPRFEPRSVRLDVRAETTVVDLTLEPGLRLAGRVVGEGGEPLRRAWVRLSQAPSGRIPETTTDADGAFELVGLEAGSYLLTAGGEGYAESRLDEPVEVGDGRGPAIEVRLDRGGTIVGSLLGLTAGEVARIAVTAASDLLWRHGDVAGDGTYRILHAAPGTWTVTASDPATGRSATGEVNVVAPGLEVQLDLDFAAATPPPPVQ